MDAAHEKHGRSLTHQVMHELGQTIVVGDYGPDNPFPIEAELCRRLGVSRSILREAVKMLTAKGMLGSRPRQGTFVEPEHRWNVLDPDVLGWLLERKFSPQLLLEFLEVRLAIEPMAARLAARVRNEAACAAIAHALQRMQAAETGEDDPLTSDIAFHVAILMASGNPFYARLRDLIVAALRTSIRLTNKAKGVRLASIADHARVYHAIMAGDEDGADAAMHALITEAMALAQTLSCEPASMALDAH